MDRNDSLVNDDVHEIDLYKHEPWDLPSLCANEESHDQTWYFFCKHEKDKSHQTRTTKVGFWKSTGRDRNVKNKAGKEIGKKKTLRFHIGRTRHGERTEWTIHEYSSSSSVLPHQTHFVLCKLMKKNAGKADASGCHEKPLGNPPSNNENGEIVMPEVDQEPSLSPDFWDSLQTLEKLQPPLAVDPLTILKDGFSEEELSPSAALDDAHHEHINESYADFAQALGPSLKHLVGESRGGSKSFSDSTTPGDQTRVEYVCLEGEDLTARHRQIPRFVYIAVVLIGLILFVVISREMLVFH